MRQWIQNFERELRATVTRPGTQLTRGQRFAWWCIDLARHARQELREASATTMAAALTYRTIFGLVPMIVMALIVFRAFGGFEGSQQGLTNLVYSLLDLEDQVADVIVKPEETEPANPEPNPKPDAEPNAPAEPAPPATEAKPEGSSLSWFGKKVNKPPPTEPDTAADEAIDPEEADRLQANEEMRERIDDLIGSIADGATSINIGSIGVAGTVLLIWAALGLVITVEKTFNVIYNAPQGRPWHLRIPIYWAVITLGPVLIWASFYLSTQFIAFAAEFGVVGEVLIWIVKQFSALMVTWLLFLLLFKLMPNAQVAVRPAMVGAMVSALAWELMKVALRGYIEGAVVSKTQAQLYGSLALIPILLFWVYLSWLVVLAGLEVAHILQTLPGNRQIHFEKNRKPHSARDPWLVIPVMSAVSQAFDQGKTVTIDQVATAVDAAPTTVAKIVDELVGRGLLHRLSREEGADTLALAMPPGRIRIADLIAADAGEAQREKLPGHDLLMQLARAQDKALADVTLASKAANEEQ